MTRIAVEGLRKEFGDIVAVENLDLEIDDKEFVCLLGPSGCGKTTTLNCIAGLETPTSGKICFDGVVMNDTPPKDRGIGLVFQSYALFPHMTVYQNLAFPLKIRSSPKKEIMKEIEGISNLLELEPLLRLSARTLSMSQKQKVAIARTLLSKPRVLMFDEPLSNLDAQTRTIMRGELKRMAKEVEQTVVYVTHDQLEAMTMADRIAVMNKGRLQQCGTPGEVYDRPTNRFVANFIGSPSMNFLNCTYEEKEEKAYLVHEAFSYDITDFKNLIAQRASGRELILGIRPEHVKISDKKAGEESIEATVYVAEPLGSETLLELAVGPDILRANIPGIVDMNIGDKSYVQFDRDRINIFDAKTENLIK